MRYCLKEIRKKMGIKQEELAISYNVSRQTINAIENNKYDPSLSLAFRLASMLHVKMDDVFNYNRLSADDKKSSE